MTRCWETPVSIFSETSICKAGGCGVVLGVLMFWCARILHKRLLGFRDSNQQQPTPPALFQGTYEGTYLHVQYLHFETTLPDLTDQWRW
jgi:hypothetical protein